MVAGTEMGGEASSFPETSWSVVRRAQGDELAAPCLEQLARLYWKPVYSFVRAHWRKSNEEAKDLTQEFFARLLERGTLGDLRSDEIRFRVFLRACLQNFLLASHRDANRLKRGGGKVLVPLEAEVAVVAPDLPPEKEFDRAWARTVLDGALAALREIYESTGRAVYWHVFERCSLAEPPEAYEACAAALGLSRDDVHNRLRHARKTLRGLIRERVRDTLLDASELEDELLVLERALGPT